MQIGKQLNRVVIVGSRRIPFAKSQTHYAAVNNQQMMTHVLEALVQSFGLKNQKLGEVALGALIKHPNDRALARECVLSTGLDPHTPAFDLQRACGTSLEATVAIANKIALGQIETGIAGGTDTNSDPPLTFRKPFVQALMKFRRARSLSAKLGAWSGLHLQDLTPEIPRAVEARTGLLMGDHCELMAQEWNISRAEQDELAYLSHKNGAAAYERGFFNDMVVEYEGLKRDAILRADSSIEKLAKLSPAFEKSDKGTLTAGNSSPLSDGAAAVLLASESYAIKKGWPILAYVRDAQTAAVDFVGGEGLLMAPTYAASEMLRRQGLELQDFDLYEIHEAFAAQVLCTLRAWESADYCRTKLGRAAPMGRIDRAKLNTVGSSLALGHPFAATGARVVGTLAKLLSDRKGGRGLVSICTAGGMGSVMILEK